MVDEKMLGFVKEFIEQHDPIATKLKKRFPFRRLFDHCYRCCRWAQRISDIEGGEREVAEVSALFHDVGKCIDNAAQGHADAGAKICEGYLDSIDVDPGRRDRIVQIVRDHIHHCRKYRSSLEAKIESDADLLDETGAMTVLWDCMAVGREDNPSYGAAHKRIRGAYDQLRGRSTGHFHTEAARRFFEERRTFLGDFVRNLELELGLIDGLPRNCLTADARD